MCQSNDNTHEMRHKFLFLQKLVPNHQICTDKKLDSMCHVLKSATEGDFQIVDHHTPTNPERYRCRNREQSFKANACYMMMMISIEY